MSITAVGGAVTIVLGLFALLAIGVTAWFYARKSVRDLEEQEVQKEMARLRASRDDARSDADEWQRKFERAEAERQSTERENATLRELHNPTQQIADLAEQEQANHELTFEVLTQQAASLNHIDETLTNLPRGLR